METVKSAQAIVFVLAEFICKPIIMEIDPNVDRAWMRRYGTPAWFDISIRSYAYATVTISTDLSF